MINNCIKVPGKVKDAARAIDHIEGITRLDASSYEIKSQQLKINLNTQEEGNEAFVPFDQSNPNTILIKVKMKRNKKTG